MDKIDLRKIIRPFDEPHSFDCKLDKSNLDADKPFLINKIMELNIDIVEELCEVYIKSKHTKIIIKEDDINNKEITKNIRRPIGVTQTCLYFM